MSVEINHVEPESAAGDRRLTALLSKPVAADSVVFFRICFGLLVMLDCFWFLQNDWVNTTFVQPPFLFKYYFFEWIHPWPGQGMHLQFAALMLLSGCVAVGLFYRVAAVLLAAGLTYVFLLEKAIYLNHMYLICLVAWLLAVIPAHHGFSLDALRNVRLRSAVLPAWCVWILRFQIGVPYFFGGVAKLERDWLSGDTVFMFFINDTGRPIIGPWLTSDLVVMTVSWFGLLFDLLIVPLLLYKRTRLPAYCLAILFHLSNSQLFNIGIFPWMMMGATLIFFEPDWPRRLPGQWLSGQTSTQTPGPPQAATASVALRSFLAAWVILQVVLPFRQYLYPGNPSWRDEGHSFCWRMMLRRKISSTRVLLRDNSSGELREIPNNRFLTPRQLRNMSRSPDMMLQYAHYLQDFFREQGVTDVSVFAEMKVSMNGRPSRLMIDPNVDLTTRQRQLRPADWIRPLTGPTLTETGKRWTDSSGTGGPAEPAVSRN